MIDLQTAWFILMGVLMAGYGILDGFDLGVGILHIFAKTDEERRLFMHSIGPVWDGNEVWLVVFGGALFAAFPDAYAAAFSGFYLPFMILLCALIFRGVSLEFRSKHVSKLWRNFWDVSFFLSSAGIAFLLGVAVGTTMLGLPLDKHGFFTGGLKDVFQPYPLLVGLLSVAGCTMHGAIYLYMKTEGELQKRIHDWMWKSFGFFLVVYLLCTVATLIQIPQSHQNFDRYPFTLAAVFLNILAIANVPRAMHLNKPGQAFLSSAAVIVTLTALFGTALFPNLVRSSVDPNLSLTIYNASSSGSTLGLMLIIAGIGIPFVLTYTGIVYWVFRGKVRSDEVIY